MRERDRFKLRNRIGMVFQESALFDSLNVEDNVAYRLNEERVPSDESHKRVEEVLNFVELPESRSPSSPPSSPEACVAASPSPAPSSPEPDLILYDSPTGGLDPITSTTIVELVVKQRDVSHTTALLITHRLQDAFTLATNRWNDAENKMEPIPDGGIDDSTKFLVLNEGKDPLRRYYPGPRPLRRPLAQAVPLLSAFPFKKRHPEGRNRRTCGSRRCNSLPCYGAATTLVILSAAKNPRIALLLLKSTFYSNYKTALSPPMAYCYRRRNTPEFSMNLRPIHLAALALLLPTNRPRPGNPRELTAR